MGYRGFRKTDIDPNFKFTEEFIQDALSRFFTPNAVKYDIDGLFVFEWESDKLLETRSGYIYEFEIKISKSDFKNDFKHKRDKHIILEGGGDYKEEYLPKYYEILEENEKLGKWAVDSFHKWADKSPRYKVEGHRRPNFFYYVVPVGLIEPEDVPSYAGLVYVDQDGDLSTIKSAPRLHKDKYSDEDLNLGEKFYYNMVRWRTSTKKQVKETKFWQKRFDDELASKGQAVAYKELEEKCKELERTNKELVENARKSEQQLHRDLYHQNAMNRYLIHEMQKYKPDFNYWDFEKEKLG